MKTLFDVISSQKSQALECVKGLVGTCRITGQQKKLEIDIYSIGYNTLIVVENADVNYSYRSEYCYTRVYDNKLYITVPMWVAHLEEFYSKLTWEGDKPEASELSSLIDDIKPETIVSFNNDYLLAIGDTLLNPDILWASLFERTADTPLWCFRELKRLNDGTYVYLPKRALKLLSKEQTDVVMSYFPHLSSCQEGLIAYTQSPEKGEADVQTTIKPGKFLAKVLPGIDNEVVKSFAAVFSSTNGLRLVIEKSKEAFQYAYIQLENSGSCMDARSPFSKCVVDGEWVHPATAYYHSENELHIIYAVNEDGRVVARCIGNAATKTHTRVYFDRGVPDMLNKMHTLLKKAGWNPDEDGLSGVVMSKLVVDSGEIVCPYISPGNVGVEIHHDHLVIGGNVESDIDSGLLKKVGYVAYCDCCNEGIEECDDMHHTYEDETVCSYCCNDRYTTAFDLREMHYTYVSDGSPSIYTMNGTLKLPYGNKLYDGDIVVEVNAYRELVHLDPDFYQERMVANYEDCYVDSLGHGILTDDIEKFGLFYNYEVGDICDIDSWAILDGELTRILPGHDLSNYQLDFSSEGQDYPMLKCYSSK